MSRTLTNTASILNGGSTYCFVRVIPQTADTYQDQVYGTLKTYSFSTTDVNEDTLLNIDGIDISGDPYKQPLAQIGDVQVTLENTAGTFSTGDYIGRTMEIYLGAGTTMSYATSDLMFRGTIYESNSTRKDFYFTGRSPGQKNNIDVGDVLPITVNEKYRGKIQSFAYGDWTDTDAFLPVIVTGEASDAPNIAFDNQPWKSFDSLLLYDKEQERGYEVTDTTQFTIATDNNELDFILDTTATLTLSIGQNNKGLTISDNSLIDFDVSTGSNVPSQTLIKIDDEVMLVVYVDTASSTGIHVERGFAGSTKATHSSGAAIFQFTASAGAFLIKLNQKFYPTGFAGSANLKTYFGNFQPRVQNYTGDINDLLDSAELVTGVQYNSSLSSDFLEQVGVNYDMVFEKLGFSGPITNQYILISCTSQVTVGASSDNEVVENSLGVSLDGDWNGDNYLRCTRAYIQTGTSSDVFNNISGADNETDLDCKMPTFYTFTVSGISTNPVANATYTNNGETFTIIGSNLGYTELYCTGTGDPSASGTLTKSGGTGQSSITFSAFSQPSIALTDIGDLSTTRYSLVWRYECKKEGASSVSGSGSNKVYTVGFRIDFNVSPIEYDFYCRGETRKYVSGTRYTTTAAGAMYEEPTAILEDYLRTEIGLGDSEIDQTAFEDYETARTAWKMALAVWGDMKL